MKYIFKSAQQLLTPEEFNHWIYFAYGVMENTFDSIPDKNGILSIAELKFGMRTTLIKGITQEILAREKVGK